MKEKKFSLDLGCGIRPKNHYGAQYVYGVDIALSSAKIAKADLTIEPIPYPDDFFHYCTAHDFLEHIPRVIYSPDRVQPFINVMSEIYRVLRPGGLFYSETPAVPSEPTFQDPTHVNYITSETYKYFAGRHLNLCRMYGFRG